MAVPISAVIMVPYRDANNREVRYAPAYNSIPRHMTYSSPYDSDNEPLIARTAPDLPIAELDDDSLRRFTATGRPMPGFQMTSLQHFAGDMYSAPRMLPKRYTDDSIIPAIVVDVIPSSTSQDGGGAGGRKGVRRASLGFLGKLKGAKKDEGKGITKVVYMPRREYLKFFARGLKGEYIGSEEFKRWTEEELEESFGRYRPTTSQKRKGSVPFF